MNNPLNKLRSAKSLGISLLRAIAKREIDAAKIDRLIAAGADVDARRTPDNETPLFRAARRGRTDIVLKLIKAGASLDMRDQWGNTALCAAISSGAAEATQALIAAGTDVNTRNHGKATPLFAAARLKDKSFARALIEAGADATRVDASGHTASRLAYLTGNRETGDLISETAHRAASRDVGTEPVFPPYAPPLASAADGTAESDFTPYPVVVSTVARRAGREAPRELSLQEAFQQMLRAGTDAASSAPEVWPAYPATTAAAGAVQVEQEHAAAADDHRRLQTLSRNRPAFKPR